MELTTVRELYHSTVDFADKEITVGGWVRSIRASKAFGFIVLGDGSFFKTLQIVYDEKLGNFDDISKLNVGSSLIVTGKLVETPDAPQPFEIHALPSKSKALPHPTILFRKSVILPSISERSLTFAPAQICFRLCSVYAPLRHMRFTNSFRSVISCMYTPRSLPEATVKAPGRCSA